MKYFILVFFMWSFCFGNVYSQNEYYYALEIQNNRAQILSNPDNKTRFAELYDFAKNPLASDGFRSQQIINEFESFLRAGIKAVEPDLLEGNVVGGLIGGIGAFLNPILSQEEFLFAFTDVIIERAQEELAMAYFDRAARKMLTEKLIIEFDCGIKRNPPSVSEFLPHFYMLAKNSRNNLNLSFGNTMVSAFKNDLEGMYAKIDQMIIPDCYKSTSEYSIQNAMNDVYAQINGGNSLEMIMNGLGPEMKLNSNEADHFLNLLSGMSKSLMSIDNMEWIRTSSMPLNLFGSQYYVSLLYNNPDYNGSFNKVGFGNLTRNVDEIFWFTNSVINKYEQVRDKINQINSSLGSDDFMGIGLRDDFGSTQRNVNVPNTETPEYGPLELVGDLLPLFMEFKDLPGVNLDDSKIIKSIEIVSQMLRFYNAIKFRNYGDAALAVLMTLENYSDEIEADIPTELVKYVVLAADIAQSQNSAAAKIILENAILPHGSYKIKRTVRFSASLNAYLGVNGGMEFLDNRTNFFDQGAPYVGPFLPVGVDLSISRGTEDVMRGSTSLFISAFDLGAIAGYRFKSPADDNYSVERAPKIRFEHFISPGVFLIRGFRKSPISIGFGGQYTPSLRNIKGPFELDFNSATSFRFTGFLAVDIPLLNLGMRGRRKVIKARGKESTSAEGDGWEKNRGM